MKLSKTVAGALIKAIRDKIEPEVVATGPQELSVYLLDDMNLAFTTTERQDFYGVTFEALGRDFTVVNNLEVLIVGENDEGDEESFVVEDELLIQLIEEFLLWRIKVLEAFEA